MGPFRCNLRDEIIDSWLKMVFSKIEGKQMINKVLFSLLVALTVPLSVYGQSCKVEDADIAQEYSGECKDGWADGVGRAKGRDEYQGGFQRGKKHGPGIYTWADGSKFEAEFNQDRVNGFGTYTEPLKIYYRAKKTSQIKGRIVGDVFMAQGWWENDEVVFECPDKTECQKIRQARDKVALEHIHTGACAGSTGTQESQIPESRFVGNWSGKWDAKWPLLFSVSLGSRPHTFSVVYEWEAKHGAPMSKRLFSACIRQDVLVIDAGFIDMKLSSDAPDSATLTGKFSTPRVAELKRVTN